MLCIVFLKLLRIIVGDILHNIHHRNRSVPPFTRRKSHVLLVWRNTKYKIYYVSRWLPFTNRLISRKDSISQRSISINRRWKFSAIFQLIESHDTIISFILLRTIQSIILNANEIYQIFALTIHIIFTHLW